MHGRPSQPRQRAADTQASGEDATHRIAFLGLAVLFPLLAAAAESRALWICSLSQDAVQLLCIADTDPRDDSPAQAAPTTVVRGTAFPLDARRMYVVDLWSPPTEMDFVEQLARSSICHRSEGCGVLLVRERVAPPLLARR